LAQHRIDRDELLFAACAAAAPGVAATAVLLLTNAVSPWQAALALVVVGVSAWAVGRLWARDSLALRRQAANLGPGEYEADAPVRCTPLGTGIARNLEEGRRRIAAAQQALEARAVDAERIIDALPEPLLVLDRQRRILHDNYEAEALFGRDLVGRTLSEVLRHPDVLEAVDVSLSDRKPQVVNFDVVGPVPRRMQARIAPLHRYGGGETAVVALQDLTTLVRAEQMRVDFVANVSHELRTPLTSLAGFIETMQGPARGDEQARDRFLNIMADQTQRMSCLVDDLLSLSRIELDEHNPPADTVEIAPVIDAVLDFLMPVAAERGTQIAADVGERPLLVVGDGDQLFQVLRNLVENAVKYGRRGGEVRIGARIDGDQVAIAVADDGEGIAREHQHRLTERFYRVGKARSRTVEGTGLGLAIVKHIMNRHRGRLRIDSRPGEGSTFTVYLPRRREEPA